jgi:pimeloyl-ACP methyl ester carboxylesterase
VLDSAMKALDSLDRGEHVDVAGMNPALLPLFRPLVQDVLIDDFRYDPAKLAASLELPLRIVQGDRDLHVAVADAKTLVAAQPRAELVLLPAMNHVLKDVATDDRAANFATYADSSLPVDPKLVDAIARFVKR